MNTNLNMLNGVNLLNLDAYKLLFKVLTFTSGDIWII